MSITVKTKYLDRRGWASVMETDFRWMELETAALPGVAGLIQIRKVAAPALMVSLDEPIIIADEGYSWLSVGPRDGHWWLTAMYDAQERLIQYYFDITRENIMQGGDSCFGDLMLDVVVAPGGKCELLDVDELNASLAAGNITPEDHRTACQAAREILENISVRRAELDAFCRRTREALLRGGQA